MGVGKTKPIIDSIAWLYLRQRITGALILAPKAVAPNWARDELPKHMPDAVAGKTRVLLWHTERYRTRKYQRELEMALAHPGLLIVCMSYDGIMVGTPGKVWRLKGEKARQGYHVAKELLTSRRCMMVLDESTHISKPSSKRSIRVLSASRYAAYRRALSGTPVDDKPFDIFAQIKFLRPPKWWKSYKAFQSNFGEFEMRLRRPRACRHDDPATCTCKRYPALLYYKNLDELHEAVDRTGSRLLKSEVLDLPPKIYQKRYFELTGEQRRVYDELRRKLIVWLEGGDMITAPLVITQLLRLQQITSGYCPTDDGGTLLFPGHLRIPLLLETLAEADDQVIIWTRFRQDVEQIMAALADTGISAVRYDGQTSHQDREAARSKFQGGEVRAFVANPKCAGEGLTLHAASRVLYYTTDYRLSKRLQSEDRAHRAGMPDRPVIYIDLVALDTVDEKVLDALRAKKDLADEIMGDPRSEWI
jgi:SNF2 family DNA or RNA helicase